jgi:nicotinamidase/pyrazinamidase
MNTGNNKRIKLKADDALIVVDVQKDFLPGGNLPVPEGNRIVPVIQRYIDIATSKGIPVFATRDWHPVEHASFRDEGGPWPPHCVAETEGADFAPGLRLTGNAEVISKGTELMKDAYSGFEGTNLDERLHSLGVKRLLIGGLATDYCVLNTVKDALGLDYEVLLLVDAIRAVNVNPGDEENAIEEMKGLGAVPIRLDELR